MQAAGLILFDLLGHFIINSDFLAVDDFLDPLAFRVLAGNLGIDSDNVKIILFLGSQCDHRLYDLSDFLGARLSGNDLAVIQQSGYLVAEQCLSEFGLLTEFSVLCHVISPSMFDQPRHTSDLSAANITLPVPYTSDLSGQEAHL